MASAPSFTQALSAPGSTGGVAATLTFVGPATLTATWSIVPPPPTPAPTPCAGTMCATTATSQTCGSSAVHDVDLTAEGAVDWAHWGTTDTTTVDRKAMSGGGASKIGSLELVGANTEAEYANSGVGFSWSDGVAPRPTSKATTTGVYQTGEGTGFAIVVPVATISGSTIIKVWVGTYIGAGELTATISDGSTAPLKMHGSCDTGTAGFEFTITVKGAKPGSTVKLTWVQTSDGGNITFQAVALSGSTANAERAALSGGNITFMAATLTAKNNVAAATNSK